MFKGKHPSDKYMIIVLCAMSLDIFSKLIKSWNKRR